jgi:hypothetical protein
VPHISESAVFILAMMLVLTPESDATDLPFGPGESILMRITYAHILAGRARMSVEAAELEGRPVWNFVVQAWTEGFFPRFFRFRVRDRTVATWEPESGCSLGIEKHLREGRARRDQVIRIDPKSGVAHVVDRKINESRFELPPCTLDVLSAFFVTRVRGVPETSPLTLPIFDNGKRYQLGVKLLGRERLDLPPPLGKRCPTVIVEPMLLEGSGLFVRKGRLKIWLTDDDRRIPVRMRSKVPLGSVSADLESYVPPTHADRETP